MQAALLCNLTVSSPSYPIQQGRGKREFWLLQYPPALVADRMAKARAVKEACERLRALPETSAARQAFRRLARPYVKHVPNREQLQAIAMDLNHLEMAIDKKVRADLVALLEWADEEDLMVLL